MSSIPYINELLPREKGSFPQCVGCGYCCWKVLCYLAIQKHGRGKTPNAVLAGGRMDGYLPGPCPELVWDEKAGRHWCRIVLEEGPPLEGTAKKDLSIGEGCCSSLNSWRREPIQDRRDWKND